MSTLQKKIKLLLFFNVLIRVYVLFKTPVIPFYTGKSTCLLNCTDFGSVYFAVFGCIKLRHRS